MEARKKLFRSKSPYDIQGTEELFVKAMRQNALYQYAHCKDYKRILDEAEFAPEDINNMEDLERLPFLPTLYFKHHKLFSMLDKKMLIRATSSGTSGTKSECKLQELYRHFV